MSVVKEKEINEVSLGCVKVKRDMSTPVTVYNIYVDNDLVAWVFKYHGEVYISLDKNKVADIHIC
jgi:hypothetical protein